MPFFLFFLCRHIFFLMTGDNLVYKVPYALRTSARRYWNHKPQHHMKKTLQILAALPMCVCYVCAFSAAESIPYAPDNLGATEHGAAGAMQATNGEPVLVVRKDTIVGDSNKLVEIADFDYSGVAMGFVTKSKLLRAIP